MKTFIKSIVFVLFIVCLFSLSACGDLNIGDIIDKIPDYEYSDDGIVEAENFFADVNDSNGFIGQLSYTIIANETKFNLDVYRGLLGAEQSEENFLIKASVGEENYGILRKGNQKYYIDYKNKFLSTSINDTMKGMTVGLLFAKFGIPQFTKDGQEAVEFIEKKDATVPSVEGQDVETVEFKYVLLSTEESQVETTMYINFNKKLPVINRMYFEEYDAENEETTTYTVYLVTKSKTVPEGIFVLPTEEDGYTININ